MSCTRMPQQDVETRLVRFFNQTRYFKLLGWTQFAKELTYTYIYTHHYDKKIFAID
jgi:hypothetical protein